MLGSAFAAALGDRAGIRRFGDSSVPMDESLATAVVDAGGRPYAVVDLPFRAERAGTLPLQLVEHAIEAFARTAARDRARPGHRPQRPPPRRGRVQGARPRAARGVRGGSAARRRRVDQGLPGMSGSAARPTTAVVVDYGAGNLVSIEQALLAAGARAPPRDDAGRHRRRRPARRPGRRGGGARDGAAARRRVRRRRSATGSPTTARSSASASASSSCSRAATRTARTRWASCPAGPSASRARPTLPHIGWNQVERTRPHPAFDGIDDGRGLLLRPLVRRGSRARHRGRRHARDDQPRPPVRVRGRPGPPARRPVPPGAVGRRRPAPDRQRRRPLAGAA